MTQAPSQPITIDFAQVRAEAWPLVRHYVVRNSGQVADAEDLLQEALMVLHQRLAKPGFVLTVPAKAYLFAVARNHWLKELRRRRNGFMQIEVLPDSIHTQAEDLAAAERQERQLHTWLGRITLRCQRLLTDLFLLSIAAERVRATFGYATPHTLASQKHKCLQSLRAEAGSVQPQ